MLKTPEKFVKSPENDQRLLNVDHVEGGSGVCRRNAGGVAEDEATIGSGGENVHVASTAADDRVGNAAGEGGVRRSNILQHLP